MNAISRRDPHDAWMADVLRSRADDPGPRDGCPQPDRIWDAVRMGVPLDERLEIVDHLVHCPTCAEAWSLAAELVASLEPAASSHTPSRHGVAWFGQRAALVAAAALLVLAVGMAWMLRPAGQSTEESAETRRPGVQETATPVEPDEAMIRTFLATYEKLLVVTERERRRVPSPVRPVDSTIVDPPKDRDLLDVALHVESVLIEGGTAVAQVTRRDTVMVDGQRRVETYPQVIGFKRTPTGTWEVESRLGSVSPPPPRRPR